MDMLCLMHEAERYGYLELDDKPISVEQLARALSATEAHVEELLGELKAAGVLNVDRKGRIHSPRMIKDRELSEKGRFAAKSRYSQTTEKDNESDTPSGLPTAKKREVRGEKTDHREEPSGSSKPSLLPDGWSPDPHTLEKTAVVRPDLVAGALTTELDRFRNYWVSNGTPQAFKRDWEAAWLYWIAKPPRNAQETVSPKETKTTVRLHRSLHPELFAACEKLRGKKVPSDEWSFDRDLVAKAGLQLSQGPLNASGWGIVNRADWPHKE